MMNIIIGMLAWQAICFLVGWFVIEDEETYALFTTGVFAILFVPIAYIDGWFYDYKRKNKGE